MTVPIQSEQQVKNDLKSGAVASVYLIFGDDGYLKKQCVEKLCASVCEKDDPFNFMQFSGDCDLQDVYDAKEQFPLMADKKCVILKDYAFDRLSKEDFAKLCELCGTATPETLFLLWYDTVEIDPKRDEKAKKLISATEKCGGKVIQVAHRGTAELCRMLCDGAKKRGTVLSTDDARYMVEQIGGEINLLVSELEKLCAYAGGSPVDRTMVDKVCIRSVEQSVYRLSDEVLQNNVAKAIGVLDELLFLRVKPMVIFSTVSSVYVDLCRARAAAKAGVSVNTAASDFGYGKRNFVLERAMRKVNRMDDHSVLLSLRELLRTDARLKGFSGDDRTTLEEMIVRLCYITSEGKQLD